MFALIETIYLMICAGQKPTRLILSLLVIGTAIESVRLIIQA